MKTLIHKRVDQARNGQNEKVICRMKSGWAVLGDTQHLPGYCLLLPDPVVPSLNHLTELQRSLFLTEMTFIGDAILASTDAIRINYEILGNTEEALHAHIFARYKHESNENLKAPVWFYKKEIRLSVPFNYERDKSLIESIKKYLKKEN